jgi:hypothetical protein
MSFCWSSQDSRLNPRPYHMSRSEQDQYRETLLPLSWLKFAISAKAWHIRQTDHAGHLSRVRRLEASPADRK